MIKRIAILGLSVLLLGSCSSQSTSSSQSTTVHPAESQQNMIKNYSKFFIPRLEKLSTDLTDISTKLTSIKVSELSDPTWNNSLDISYQTWNNNLNQSIKTMEGDISDLQSYSGSVPNSLVSANNLIKEGLSDYQFVGENLRKALTQTVSGDPTLLQECTVRTKDGSLAMQKAIGQIAQQ